MGKSIVLSVGSGGVNFPADVARVRELLKAVAARTPQPPSAEGSGVASADLAEAIRAFQKQYMAMKQPTGRVDPDSATLCVLNRIALGQESKALPGSLRERIVQAALGEVGKVSDRQAIAGKRKGHQALKSYIDVAGRNRINWADKTKRKYIGPKPLSIEYNITNLEGVEKPGMRIPQGQGLGIQWCGIFATWAWITGGADVYWDFPGPTRSSGKALSPSANFKCVAPGDMCVLPGIMQHHIIVVSVSADGKKITSVEGNREWQEIGTDSHEVSKLQSLYSLDTALNPSISY